MKRFKWPLQRILELTHQKERMMQGKLFNISQQIASVHRRIFQRRSATRTVLGELSQMSPADRLSVFGTLTECLRAEKKHLDELQEQLSKLQSRRSETMSQFKRTRQSREALDKLRQRALEKHLRRLHREEQKQNDESARLVYVRTAGKWVKIRTDEVAL